MHRGREGDGALHPARRPAEDAPTRATTTWLGPGPSTRTTSRRALARRAARGAGYVDLGFARLDTHRAARTGDAEVVYGAGKTPEQVIDLLRALRQASPDRARRSRPGCTPTTLAARARRRSRRRSSTTWRAPASRSARCPSRAAGSSSSRPARRDAPVAAEAAFVAARVRRRGRARRRRRRRRAPPAARRPRAARRRPTASSSSPGWRARCPSRGRRPGRRPAGRGADLGRLRRLVRRPRRAARDAQLLRARASRSCNIDNGFGAGVFAARVARRAYRRRPTGEPRRRDADRLARLLERAPAATCCSARWSTPACRSRSSQAPSPRSGRAGRRCAPSR